MRRRRPVTGETIHTIEVGAGVDALDVLVPPTALIPIYGELDAMYTRPLDIPLVTPWSEQLLSDYYINNRATNK